MIIAIVQNNAVVKTGTYSDIFPNVSVPVTGAGEEFDRQNSVYPILEWLEHDASTQKLEFVTPYFKDGQVLSVTVVAKTESDYTAEREAAAEAVRSKRNELLAQSDWTQVADAPVDKAAWAEYRQALRDISLQSGFPFEVVFPVTPAGTIA